MRGGRATCRHRRRGRLDFPSRYGGVGPVLAAARSSKRSLLGPRSTVWTDAAAVAAAAADADGRPEFCQASEVLPSWGGACSAPTRKGAPALPSAGAIAPGALVQVSVVEYEFILMLLGWILAYAGDAILSRVQYASHGRLLGDALFLCGGRPSDVGRCCPGRQDLGTDDTGG
jgi:hypothetical protein